MQTQGGGSITSRQNYLFGQFYIRNKCLTILLSTF